MTPQTRHRPFLMHSAIIFLSLFLTIQAQSFPDPGNCVLVSNPPPNGQDPSQCNFRGTYDDQFEGPISTQTTTNLTECRNVCLRRIAPYQNGPGCNSFGFDSSNNECSLYAVTTYYSVTSNSSSTSVFYDPTCFSCPGICPAQPGATSGPNANLLDNAGFEVYSNNIAPWIGNFGVPTAGVSSPGYMSNRDLEVDYDVTGGYWYVTQVINSCPFTCYNVSFEYRFMPETGSNASLSVLAGNLEYASGNPPYADETLQLNKWAGFKDFFYPTGAYSPFYDTSAELFIEVAVGDGRLNTSLDNAVIKPCNANLTPAASAPQLLRNQKFQSGALAPWTVKVTKQRGSGSVVCSGTGTSNCVFRAKINKKVLVNPAVTLQQPIATSLTLGSQYVVSFKYNTSESGRFDVTFGPSTYSFHICNDNPGTLPCSGTVTMPLIARQTKSTLGVVVYGQANQSAISIDLGSFSLKAL